MHLKFDILTLFPQMIEGFSCTSMIAKAQENKIIAVKAHDIRSWAEDKHKTTDALPYGGGAGMVMKPEPLFKAIESLKGVNSKVIYMAPDGIKLNSKLSEEISHEKHLIILSGHYEGVDQRVRDELIDMEISIGEFVLTNGTLPAIVLVDAVSRFIPGFLGDEKSLTEETFMNSLLAFPQYTRPAKFRDLSVPEILLSGNHVAIEKWRHDQRLKRTSKLRPDLLENKDT